MKSGHLDVALSHIGRVLIYCPSENGLWIPHAVAEALNKSDAEEMRHGYISGLYNIRGAHCVDPTGKPEKELADKYNQRADEVESVGYHRLASTLKDLAASYTREAERIINEH